MIMSYCPFPSSIPQICRDAARLYYLCEKHKNHHKKERKHNLLSLCHAVDSQAGRVSHVSWCLDRSINDGDLAGVIYFKFKKNEAIKLVKKLQKENDKLKAK